MALKKCFSWGICPRRSQGGRVDKASQGLENMWATRRSWSFLGLSGGRWVVEKGIMVEADINKEWLGGAGPEPRDGEEFHL